MSNQTQTNSTYNLYNIPIGNKLPNATHAMRHPEAVNGLFYQPCQGVNNVQDLIVHSVQINGHKDLIGTKNPKTNVYNYESFKNIYEKAVAVGSSLHNMNLLKVTNEYKNFRTYNKADPPFDGTLKLVGIYTKNRAEWTICDMANGLYGYTMIPLYDTLGPDSASFVLGHSGIISCVCSAQSIEILSKTNNLHSLKNIISIDDDYSQEAKEILQKRGLRIISLLELIIQGKQNKVPLPKNISPDSIFSFSYTSGTTGNPKGAMITHRNVIAAVRSQINSDFKFIEDDTHLSFLPLPHIFERFIHVICWFTGTRIAYYGGDMLKLKDDLVAAKPTKIAVVPRILNKFYEEINNYVASLPQPQRDYVEKAIREKLAALKSKETYTVVHPVYDEQIFKKIQGIFGGRLRAVVSGSAPISQKVLDFMKVVLCCPVEQGYGQTEGTGLGTCRVFADISENNVGGVASSAEMKLEDVPEMGYYSTDKDEHGNPTPRGEICIRGHTVFAGYYMDDEKTAESFDADGWLHSGDIGTILPNGALRIFDRRKNIFKLQQGEYVSPEKIENTYIRARGVQEAFVHGDSLQSYCIAIIIPKPDEIVKIAKELNINEPLEALYKNQLINQFYLRTIQEYGKKEGLFSFEQAQKIYLEPVSLVLHGCLTASFKLQRHIAKNIFKKVIDELYSTPLPPRESPRL